MSEVTISNEGNVCVDETMDHTNNSNVENEGGEEDIPKHPYHLKLAEFVPNAWQLEECEPEKPLPLEKTKLTLIVSQDLLDEMMTTLKQVKEFSMDVIDGGRHRSFTGMAFLLRISTRTEDFIIDSLTLKEELSILNEVCTDTNILKVLHISHENILGLQRDFGVYIINMFDPIEAAKILREDYILPQILKETCNIHLEKTHQISDWRIRPLSSEMINYFRENIHYLLYIYDIYKNKLLHASTSTKNLLTEVYRKSTELCGTVYVEPVFNADSYKDEYKKAKGGTLTPRQLECFRLLYAWREKTAREQDRGTGFTLPKRMMFQIAKRLPTSLDGIAACCKSLPPLLGKNLPHIQTLVMEAIKNIPEELAAGKFCFLCEKRGHLPNNCRGVGSLNRVRNDPYGRPPRGRPPLGGSGWGPYVEGYGRSGYNPPPQANFGYGVGHRPSGNYFPGCEPIPPPYFMGYGDVRRPYF